MTAACIVKLGGSQAFSPLLRSWLEAIAAAAGNVVIVPGGGPFADAVRAAQPKIGFDDRTGHDMALLGMVQFGLALAGIGRKLGLVMAESRADIERALAARKIPVWSPQAMLREAPEVPRSWAVTSDSLALWLATVIEAPRLLLVKARGAVPGAGAAQLAADALVDPAFPDFLSRYLGAVCIAGPEDLPQAGLDARNPPGIALRALA